MKISLATAAHLHTINHLIESAKDIMRKDGNTEQWTNGYPSYHDIMADIKAQAGFLVMEETKPVGYFALYAGPEVCYKHIHHGSWIDDKTPYGVIHRIASLPQAHGVLNAILQYANNHYNNLRIDTHRDNHIMQHCLSKHGFTLCGIIHLSDGKERLAYQRVTNHV